MELTMNECLFCNDRTSVFSNRDSNLYFRLLNKNTFNCNNITDFEFKKLYVGKCVCITCAFKVENVTNLIKHTLNNTGEKSARNSSKCLWCDEISDCLISHDSVTKQFEELLNDFVKSTSRKDKNYKTWKICIKCSATISFWCGLKEILANLQDKKPNDDVIETVKTQSKRLSEENIVHTSKKIKRSKMPKIKLKFGSNKKLAINKRKIDESPIDIKLKHLRTVQSEEINVHKNILADSKMMYSIPYVKLNPSESDSDIEIVDSSTSRCPTKPPRKISKTDLTTQTNYSELRNGDRNVKTPEKVQTPSTIVKRSSRLSLKTQTPNVKTQTPAKTVKVVQKKESVKKNIENETYACFICKKDFDSRCDQKLHELEHNISFSPVIILADCMDQIPKSPVKSDIVNGINSDETNDSNSADEEINNSLEEINKKLLNGFGDSEINLELKEDQEPKQNGDENLVEENEGEVDKNNEEEKVEIVSSEGAKDDITEDATRDTNDEENEEIVSIASTEDDVANVNGSVKESLEEIKGEENKTKTDENSQKNDEREEKVTEINSSDEDEKEEIVTEINSSDEDENEKNDVSTDKEIGTIEDKEKEECVTNKEDSVTNEVESATNKEANEEESVTDNEEKEESDTNEEEKKESATNEEEKEESTFNEEAKEESTSNEEETESVTNEGEKEETVTKEDEKEESVNKTKEMITIEEESVSDNEEKDESVTNEEEKEESVTNNEEKAESVTNEKEESVINEEETEESVSNEEEKEEIVSSEGAKDDITEDATRDTNDEEKDEIVSIASTEDDLPNLNGPVKKNSNKNLKNNNINSKIKNIQENNSSPSKSSEDSESQELHLAVESPEKSPVKSPVKSTAKSPVEGDTKKRKYACVESLLEDLGA